jgi:L-alanine-DL-glutamate epimerase-like enolase superfamily enzyme
MDGVPQSAAPSGTIESVVPVARDIPLRRPFRFGDVVLDVLRYAWVRVESSEGIVGYGECPAYPSPTGETGLAAVGAVQEIAPRLLGRPIADVRGTMRIFEQVMPRALAARCGVDCALHDILGKAVGVPAHVLIGGSSNRVLVNGVVGLPAPDTDPSQALEQIVASGREQVERGHRVLKLKVGADIAMERAAVEALATELPDDVTIFVDANQAWRTAAVATSAARILAEAGAAWIEQPVVAHDLVGMRRVRDEVPAAVIADESVLTATDALRAASLGAADMLNVKLAKCGGFSGGRDILAVAEAANLPCLLGSMVESSLGMLANYHLARAHPFVTCGLSVYRDVEDDADVGLFIEQGELRKKEELPGLGYPDAAPYEAAFAN